MCFYLIGTALVKTHFPTWQFDEETYYLSCLLHDIGTADAYLTTTKLSFEFKGAIVAREFLLNVGAPEDQADAVCEAIVRHQDVFVKGGNITTNGQVLQLATILDNVGLYVHPVSSYESTYLNTTPLIDEPTSSTHPSTNPPLVPSRDTNGPPVSQQ